MNDPERNQEERARSEPLTTADLAATPARSQVERAEPSPAVMNRTAAPDDGTPALFPEEELNGLRARWSAIQTEFVDEPHRAVEEADSLVAGTIRHLAESFAKARNELENQWARGNDVSTEDLRVALRRYRSFFDRLLAV